MIQEDVLPQIKTGAKIKVYEGKNKTPFEGLIIARKHGKESGGTFTVRTITAGVGVEKVFPINSPNVTKVTIVNTPKKVHKAKLYFVRKMSGSTIRKKLKTSL